MQDFIKAYEEWKKAVVESEKKKEEEPVKAYEEWKKERPGALESLVAGFETGLRGTAGGALGGIGRIIGSETVQELGETVSGQPEVPPGVIETIKKGDWEGLPAALAGALGQATGSMAALAGAGIAGGLIGGPLGAAAAVAGGSALAALDDMATELEKRFGVRPPLWELAPAAIATGFLDASALGKVGKVVLAPSAGLAQKVKDILNTAGVEATTEAIQEALQQAAVAAQVKGHALLSQETLERMGEAAIAGAIGGGGVTGVGMALSPGLSDREKILARLIERSKFTDLEELKSAAELEAAPPSVQRDLALGDENAPLRFEDEDLSSSPLSVLKAYELTTKYLADAEGLKIEPGLGKTEGPLDLVLVEVPAQAKEKQVFEVFRGWQVPDVLLGRDHLRAELFRVEGWERVLPGGKFLSPKFLEGPPKVIQEIIKAEGKGDREKVLELFAQYDVTATPGTLELIETGVAPVIAVSRPTVRFLPGLPPTVVGVRPNFPENTQTADLELIPAEDLRPEKLETLLNDPDLINWVVFEPYVTLNQILETWAPVTKEGRAVFRALRKLAKTDTYGSIEAFNIVKRLRPGDFRFVKGGKWLSPILPKVINPYLFPLIRDIPQETGEGIRRFFQHFRVSQEPYTLSGPSVTVVADPKVDPDWVKTLQAAATQLHRLFRFKYPVELYIGPFPRHLTPYLGIWAFSFKKKQHEIALSTEFSLRPKLRTLIHEFVHGLHGERSLKEDDPLLARLYLLASRMWVHAKLAKVLPVQYVDPAHGPDLKDWFNLGEFITTHGEYIFSEALAQQTEAKEVHHALTKLEKIEWPKHYDELLRREVSAAIWDLVNHPHKAYGPIAGHSFKAHNDFEDRNGFPTNAPAALSLFPKLSPDISQDIVHWNWFMELGWTLVQIAQKNPHIASLQRYVGRIRQMQHDKVSHVLRADEILRDWRRLSATEGERLGEALFRYGGGEEKALDNLPAPEKAIADRVVAFLKKSLDDLQQILAEKIKANLSPAAQGEALQKLAEDFDQMRKSPYFPFLRFGRYSVTVRDDLSGKVLAFYLYETEKERTEDFPNIKKDFEGQLVTFEVGKLPEVLKSFIGVSPFVLRRIIDKLNLTPEQKKEVDKLLATQFPTESAKNRFLRKKKTKGFSTDAVRTFAAYSLRMSNYLATLKHADSLREDIVQVVRESRDSQTGQDVVNTTNAQKLSDWLTEHLDYVLQPQNEWVGLRTFAFLYHLGFNPASAFVNLTQPAMVTYPWLAAKFGDRIATKAVFRALRKLRKAFTGGLSPEDGAVLDFLLEQGLLDQSLVTELAGVAANDWGHRYLGSRGRSLLSRFADAASFLFHNAERINRRLVALATLEAFRLGRPKDPRFIQDLMNRYGELAQRLDQLGVLDKAPALAAIAALDETMFDYSSYNRPKFMRGRKSVLFIFMTFVQHMLWAARYMPGKGRMLLLLGAAAGLLGLPGAEDADDIVEALSSFLGERIRPSEELKALLAEVMDDPDVVLHGLGYKLSDIVALLSGFPGPDLSGHLSLGRVIPGLRGAVGITKGEIEQGVTRAAEDISGAGFAIMWRMVQAAFNPHPMWQKNLEQVMPTALRNLMMATRWMIDGKEVDRTGAAIVKFDPSDRPSIALTALGLQPAKVLRAHRERRLTQEAIRFWQARREALLQTFFWAELPHERSQVMREIMDFNKEAPVSFWISLKQLRTSYRERMRRKLMMETFGVPSKALVPFVQERTTRLGLQEDEE